jgi:hypothetical protein
VHPTKENTRTAPVDPATGVNLQPVKGGQDSAVVDTSLFDALLAAIENRVGPCGVVSLPCCIHLAATDDFLAVLPKSDRLEIRFTLHRRLDSPRIRACSQTGRTLHKHSVDVSQVEHIDAELLGWLREAYRLRAE